MAGPRPGSAELGHLPYPDIVNPLTLPSHAANPLTLGVFDQFGGVYRCGNNSGKAKGESPLNRAFATTCSSLMADGVSAILGSGPAVSEHSLRVRF
jgi:hypothetical protein